MSHDYYVYILASRKNGTLYTGVTSNLENRVLQHKTHAFNHSFTARYGVGMLVYYEHTTSIESAIAREKQIKQWRRQWKINQINSINPEWRDLSDYFMDSEINSE